MEQHNEKIKLSKLLLLKKNGMLSANPEYQRGVVWSQVLQKKLIDSVLRGYPLPLFYLHKKSVKVEELRNDGFDIIDGQQRINALYAFHEGNFKLFDPLKDDKIARFPKFIANAPCPWAGCSYEDLTDELKQKFENTELFVVNIDTENEDEARDLFIRLQAGLPLNPQEKRDAWPGGFTEFVLKFGGKKELVRYPGNDFFNEHVKKSSTDRGSVRALCAQVGMLYFENATHGNWIDIKSGNIDDYYYKNIDFDIKSTKVERFQKILEIANSCFKNYNGRHLLSHETIHVLLLIDSLLDDYTNLWLSSFTKAFDEFRKNVAEASKAKSGEYWEGYANWIRTGSDQSGTIKKMHLFFTEKMLASLNPKKKDEVRSFSELEREIIYYKHDKKCAVCQQEIVWDELDIHHIDEHQNGGKTILGNAVPVHRLCHPKGQDVEKFNKQFIENKNVSKQNKPMSSEDSESGVEFKMSSFPNGTKCKLKYKNKTYTGIINNGILTVDNNFGDFKSLSTAAKEITNQSRNGWDCWEVYVPEYEAWIKASLCRTLFIH